MGRGGGVTPRNLITPTRRLAPAGSEPFSHGETETKTRVDNISEKPAPERGLRAYHLHQTRLELIAERKLRRRQLTDNGHVEITGRDLRERESHHSYPCKVPIPHPACYIRSVVMANCRLHGGI